MSDDERAELGRVREDVRDLSSKVVDIDKRLAVGEAQREALRSSQEAAFRRLEERGESLTRALDTQAKALDTLAAAFAKHDAEERDALRVTKASRWSTTSMAGIAAVLGSLGGAIATVVGAYTGHPVSPPPLPAPVEFHGPAPSEDSPAVTP